MLNIIPLKMTDEEIVPQEDIETPAPAPEVEEDDLEPEVPEVAPPNETAAEKDARIARLEERNEKLWARLQRNKNKPAPVPPAPAPKKAETPTGLTRDEAILFAKGFDEEEVEYANKIATLEGISVTAATNTPLFTTWKSNKDADAKKLLHCTRGNSRTSGALTPVTVVNPYGVPG